MLSQKIYFSQMIGEKLVKPKAFKEIEKEVCWPWHHKSLSDNEEKSLGPRIPAGQGVKHATKCQKFYTNLSELKQ